MAELLVVEEKTLILTPSCDLLQQFLIQFFINMWLQTKKRTIFFTAETPHKKHFCGHFNHWLTSSKAKCSRRNFQRKILAGDLTLTKQGMLCAQQIVMSYNVRKVHQTILSYTYKYKYMCIYNIIIYMLYSCHPLTRKSILTHYNSICKKKCVSC